MLRCTSRSQQKKYYSLLIIFLLQVTFTSLVESALSGGVEQKNGTKPCGSVHCISPPEDYTCTQTNVTNPKLLKILGASKDCCPVWQCTDESQLTLWFLGVNGTEAKLDGSSSSFLITTVEQCRNVSCPDPKRDKKDVCVVEKTKYPLITAFSKDRSGCCSVYDCTDSEGYVRTSYVLSEGPSPKSYDGVSGTKFCEKYKCGPEPKFENTTCAKRIGESMVGISLGNLRDCCPVWDCEYPNGNVFQVYNITGEGYHYREVLMDEEVDEEEVLVVTTTKVSSSTSSNSTALKGNGTATSNSNSSKTDTTTSTTSKNVSSVETDSSDVNAAGRSLAGLVTNSGNKSDANTTSKGVSSLETNSSKSDANATSNGVSSLETNSSKSEATNTSKESAATKEELHTSENTIANGTAEAGGADTSSNSTNSSDKQGKKEKHEKRKKKKTKEGKGKGKGEAGDAKDGSIGGVGTGNHCPSTNDTCPTLENVGLCYPENSNETGKYVPKEESCCPVMHCQEATGQHRTHYVKYSGSIPTEPADIDKEKGKADNNNNNKNNKNGTCPKITCGKASSSASCSLCSEGTSPFPHIRPFIECCGGMMKCGNADGSFSLELRIVSSSFKYFEISYYNISGWNGNFNFGYAKSYSNKQSYTHSESSSKGSESMWGSFTPVEGHSGNASGWNPAWNFGNHQNQQNWWWPFQQQQLPQQQQQPNMFAHMPGFPLPQGDEMYHQQGMMMPGQEGMAMPFGFYPFLVPPAMPPGAPPP